ncbi:MAG TPA: FKBP-type peptidyl-prolyl cis-trans isomerase [Flavisolibacter sp.]|nr:FKBP-type peptidyl-prolyl cis-trans isomerase [Flavisolibacter sp.]
MKKYLIVALAFIAINAQAQKSVSKKPLSKKSADQQVAGLKDLNDSVSYAIGLSVAKFYQQQGIKNLNTALVSKAIKDIFESKKALLTETQCNEVVMHYLNPGLSKNVEKGEKFLTENKNKPNIKTTPSGLQYEVLVQGTGPKPGPTDTVVAHYKGSLLDGTEFDNSYKRGEPLSIQVNHVIPGWTEALQLMPAGSKYKLYIPYKLAYGPNDNGPIPGGSVLLFEVELLSVKGK